ncbi:MAG: hypothetical protein FJX74_09190, partial [Armatimonadetes bacterium]|nr:hypothetical protein [Armatimonadota bacterium]
MIRILDPHPMTTCEPRPLGPAIRADLAAFLNLAYADARSLPAVGVEGPDYPTLSVEALAQREEQGAETLVAYDGAEIVCAASWRRDDREKAALVDFIATHPGRRRRGCARR